MMLIVFASLPYRPPTAGTPASLPAFLRESTLLPGDKLDAVYVVPWHRVTHGPDGRLVERAAPLSQMKPHVACSGDIGGGDGGAQGSRLLRQLTTFGLVGGSRPRTAPARRPQWQD